MQVLRLGQRRAIGQNKLIRLPQRQMHVYDKRVYELKDDSWLQPRVTPWGFVNHKDNQRRMRRWTLYGKHTNTNTIKQQKRRKTKK